METDPYGGLQKRTEAFMRVQGKTDAVVKWLKTYDGIGKYLKLNAVDMKADERAVNVVYNDAKVREFIDGTVERRYTFSLVMVADWSEGFDSTNAEAMEFGEEWLDWVARQFQAGNVPNFGDECIIRAIEPLQNVPALAAAYQDVQLARYQFQAAITYWEKETE
jgi:hypothetical protein